MLNLINDLMSKKPTWGVWIISCVMHGFAEFVTSVNMTYTVPPYTMNTLQEAFEQWKSGQSRLFIDSENWPENTPCAYL